MLKIYSGDIETKPKGKIIFLAGCSPRSGQTLNWRKVAIQLLEDNHFDGTVVIPEPEHGTWSNYNDVIEWEHSYLEMADVILFWIPRDIDNRILGLTSNVEFGMYLNSGRIVYGRPDNADNVRYMDCWYKKICKVEPFNSLNNLILSTLLKF